ncbi:MAG: hypothetical protein IIB61_05550 [Planctomycetes bacterium]|nr:hypothetical protein [Planctomycetota bacterium]MCH8252650.1 hypothetical protein [Planctomycetota bacterium]
MRQPIPGCIFDNTAIARDAYDAPRPDASASGNQYLDGALSDDAESLLHSSRQTLAVCSNYYD